MVSTAAPGLRHLTDEFVLEEVEDRWQTLTTIVQRVQDARESEIHPDILDRISPRLLESVRGITRTRVALILEETTDTGWTSSSTDNLLDERDIEESTDARLTPEAIAERLAAGTPEKVYRVTGVLRDELQTKPWWDLVDSGQEHASAA
ncbi:MAG: hypothetical protein Q8P27_00015 [Candidatus Peregrinibacteria bacterium]|nr:hypothetical protein [Candidatus Peregrinibacteria bacterium]